MDRNQLALKSLRTYIYSAIFLSFILVVTLYGLFIRFEEDHISYARERSISAETQVSATIGKGKLIKIFGYTSPKSLVKLTHTSLQNHTYADDTGYFQFVDFLPFIVEGLCISSQDQFGRTTQPVCLPTLDLNYTDEIGPILLPPTISLGQSIHYIADEVIISGQTIPNTDIVVSSFVDKSNDGGAFTLPNLEARADEGGNYSVVTNASTAENYRTFVRVDYLEQLSPLSNKLLIKIYPYWYVFLQGIYMLLSFLKSNLIEFLIISELIMLTAWMLRKYLFIPFFGHLPSEIVLREKSMIERIESYPVLRLNTAIELYDKNSRSLIKI